VVSEQVSASLCGYSTFPILDAAIAGSLDAVPMIALTQPGSDGMVKVTGHMSAGVSSNGTGGPNLIVHFADERSVPDLETLTRALKESERDDAPTAILAVVGRDQLSKTRHVPGVIYAESDGTWEKVFGVKNRERPLTLIAGPKRDVRWQAEGAIDSRALSEALRKSLVKAGPARVTIARSDARIGKPPANFIFEHAPGAEVTLRKLIGRPVTLIFWNSASKPSIDAVLQLQGMESDGSKDKPVTLAINDGESVESARKAAYANKISATIVPDPERKISRAYGVSVWPTIVSVDDSGVVSGVQYGLDSHSPREYATAQQQKSFK